MGNEKYATLFKRLREQTAQGKVTWEPSNKKGYFTASVPEYSVLLSLSLRDDADVPDVVMHLADAAGNIIDSVRDIQLKEHFDNETAFYRDIMDLYETAKRQANGIDKALDSILEQLDNNDIPCQQLARLLIPPNAQGPG